MRGILFVLLAACGGPEKPIMANAPHPDNAAVAGVAAGAAAAMTIADPNAQTRGKPEKQEDNAPEKQPIEVKEQVPSSAFDHLEKKPEPAGKPAPTTAKKKGPLPKIPSPKDAAEKVEGTP